jgi:predicted nucleic acid-binding protein
VLYIDEAIVRNSVYVGQNSNLKLPDAIICATTLQKEAVLITADRQLIKAAEHIVVRAKNAL